METIINTNLFPEFFLKDKSNKNQDYLVNSHFRNGNLDLKKIKTKLFLSDNQKPWDTNIWSNRDSIIGKPLLREIMEKFGSNKICNATLLWHMVQNQDLIWKILPQEQIDEIKKERPRICFWGTIFCDRYGVKIGKNRYTKKGGLYIRSLVLSSDHWTGDFHSVEKNFSTEYPALILL